MNSPSEVEWMSNLWYVLTIKCCAVTKTDELHQGAAAWMTLHRMLRERSKAQNIHVQHNSMKIKYFKGGRNIKKKKATTIKTSRWWSPVDGITDSMDM